MRHVWKCRPCVMSSQPLPYSELPPQPSVHPPRAKEYPHRVQGESANSRLSWRVENQDRAN